MTQRSSLKDYLLNKKSVSYLADLFYQQDDTFPKKKFINNILNDLPDLELKQGITRIVIELESVLPKDFKKSLPILLKALPAELDHNKTDDDFGKFILCSFSEFIERNGCKKEYLSVSLAALINCTKRFSAEFSMREFLNQFPEQTWNFLSKNKNSSNYHIRRLVSESTRPSLPWAKKIMIPSNKSIYLLDYLFSDKTRYVTRSVANHMNDISKIDPDIVIDTLIRWKNTKKQNIKEMDFIIHHSLRTLIKKGNKKAFILLGYSVPPKVAITNLILEKNIINIGDSFHFFFDIYSFEDQNIMINYIINYPNPLARKSIKVFKIKKTYLRKNETLTISKQHLMKVMTTKKIHSGRYLCQLQINGILMNTFEFTLVI